MTAMSFFLRCTNAFLAFVFVALAAHTLGGQPPGVVRTALLFAIAAFCIPTRKGW